MKGVFQGMGLTLSHLGKHKVTRLYPYEKRELPERSRGLIQLIQEDGQDTPFHLKCEACLLCEKVCPPRAITIHYQSTHRVRKRPYFSEKARAGFYTPRYAEYAVDYPHRVMSPVAQAPTKIHLEEPTELDKVDAIIAQSSLEPYNLTALVSQVMAAYGALPLKVARRMVETLGIDLSDLYGVATALPNYAPAKSVSGVLREDQPARGPSAATRGKFGNINHRRAPNA